MHFKTEPIYSVLAHIYDKLMEEVDYSEWALYLDDVIRKHAPDSRQLLELAGGTGSTALLLEELGAYNITATDFSEMMIQKAREKAVLSGSGVRFRVMDFLHIDLSEKFDVAYMIFDSLNYLQNEEQVVEMHRQVSTVMKQGGIFIYDFTTPKNSRKAVEYLHNEEGISPGHYRYFRTSDFDARHNIHINEFEIEQLDKKHKKVLNRYVEVHRQKIYSFSEILSMIPKTGFDILACYNGFDFNRADNKSLRITMVLQWPKTV